MVINSSQFAVVAVTLCRGPLRLATGVDFIICRLTSPGTKRRGKIDSVNAIWILQTLVLFYFWADSRFASSQWETALLGNDVSHWLGASLDSALHLWSETSQSDSYKTVLYRPCLPRFVWERFRPMREDITYTPSSLIGWVTWERSKPMREGVFSHWPRPSSRESGLKPMREDLTYVSVRIRS